LNLNGAASAPGKNNLYFKVLAEWAVSFFIDDLIFFPALAERPIDKTAQRIKKLQKFALADRVSSFTDLLVYK